MRPIALISLLLLAPLTLAQKPTLKPDDYKQWESLSGARISGDGRWVSYQVSLVDGDGRLVLKNSDGPIAISVPVGSIGQFSSDSKWWAYLISPPKAIADKLREEKKPIETKLGLKNLETGQDLIVDSVMRYRFTENGKTLIAQRFRGPDKKEGGSDLVVMDLATGEQITIGNVADAQPNEKGTLVAMRIESDSGNKGVQILEPETGKIKTVGWGKETVTGLQWADKADVLAFIVGRKDEKKEGDANVIVVASNLAGKPVLKTFDPGRAKDFPAGKRVAEWRGVSLNEDGTAAAFGIADWADKKKPGKPEEKATVEVWNYKDVRVVPEQKLNAARDRQRTDLVVWRPADDSYKQVTDNEFQSPMLLKGFDTVAILDTKPYLTPITNGIGYRDIRLVSTKDGSTKKVLDKARWFATPSSEGRYIAFYDKKNWWLYEIASGKSTNLTGNLKVNFENEESDYTVPEKPAAAGAVWLKDDAGLILHDRYDAWLVKPATGTIAKLTDGRKDKVVYRFYDPYEDDGAPDLSKPLFFTILDEEAKASGFYRLDGDKGKRLAFENARLFNLAKSKNTDRVIFQRMTFQNAPDLLLTNTDFAAIKPESKLNPQQDKFAWGKAELVTFKSRWGKELAGTLVYPADYQPGKSYPMVTYIYERLSDGLHNYQSPSDWSPYNVQVLSQNGYFVFSPDIAYKGRTPGQNAVDCLEPAVAAVLAKKVGVDPNRVGLMGHSWGGYQTAFVTTVSKTFKCGVAGAPLTDLTSMYNTFYWNSGTSNQVLLETGQGRLEVPFWEDPKTYFENSAVWQSSKRTAPILIAHGDQDGAVDWHQGLALYQTLRRMGKNCVLLVYRGENHGFAKRENQLDYARRLRHFFDVYLKDVKAEPWVTDGVPFVKQADQ